MDIAAWQIYLAIGIILMIAEVFVPGLILFPIGLGVFVTAPVSVLVTSTTWQLIFMAFAITVALVAFRRFVARKRPALATTTDHIVGQEAIVTEEAGSDGLGYVKLYGDSWRAVPLDGCTLRKGDKVVIAGMEGNKVLVRAKTEN